MPTLEFINRIGRKTGRYLSNFTYVLSTLVFYLFLTLLTYVLLAFKLSPEYGKAAFLAYEIATGSDPYNFSADLRQPTWLWIWILVFHVISWLIVPVLAGTAVNAAFHSWEQRKLALNKELLVLMEKAIVDQLRLPAHEAKRLAQELKETMEIDVTKR